MHCKGVPSSTIIGTLTQLEALLCSKGLPPRYVRDHRMALTVDTLKMTCFCFIFKKKLNWEPIFLQHKV